MFPIASFLPYTLITSFTPGPNNIMSLSNASRRGFRKGISLNFGILCGLIITLTLCTLFSVALYAMIPKIKPVMLVIGAAYMLYLAWKTFRSSSVDVQENPRSGFLQGVLFQFINPKLYLYGITAMSTFILPYYNTPLILAGFVLLLALVSFISTVCWAAFGALFYKLFSKHGKIINIVMALLLVYCAISLFF